MTSDTVYKVTADFSVDASTFTPVTNFTGTLDGDGHTITWTGTSASSAKSLTESYFGLVKTNSGTIKNLTTAGSLYVSGSSSDYVGAAAGYNAGNIIGKSYLDHIAGKREGTVTNCYGLDTVSGPEKHDGADFLAPNQLEGYATIKDSKYIIELLNGSASIWGQTTGEYPYIIGNTMRSVYSFTFTGPTKTAYRAGENFSTDGLVITATPTAGEAKTVPASSYTIIDGNNLSASKESVTASGTYSGVDFSLEIPITVTGYDTVDVGTGCTCTDLDTAFRLVNKNGTIQVMNKLTISAASDLTYNKAVTIKRGAAFTGEMLEIAAGSHMVTFTTMTIDGGYGTPAANADTLFKVTSGTLRLRGNVTLNNCNVAVDVAAGSGNTADLVVNRANITGSTNSIKLENTSSNFTFENYSGGTSSSIYGDVYLATDTYITLGAALPCDITLSMQTAEVNKIVAAGTSAYTVNDADKDKLSLSKHSLSVGSNNIYISD